MKKATNPDAMIAVGIACGISIGVAMHNIGVGVGIGVGLGFALRAVTQRRLDREEGNDQHLS